MLGDIDYFKKPYKPNYFLAKPNKEIISKLSEAYGDNLKTPVNETNELSLNIPYYIDDNHALRKNKNIDLVKENYLIKMVFGKSINWYMITAINEVMTDTSDYKQITALSLEFELAKRILKGYKAESKGARTVLNEILDKTVWEIGDVDVDFELSKRSFEFLDNKILGAIYDVGNTYNAVTIFNTENKTVNMKKPEVFGLDTGLTFSYESFLKSFDKKSDANEVVTRLYLKGKDGLTINSISPTGQSYLEDYSYFMYPFSRDVNKNVIEHSYQMSDSLCHAILDYQELVEQNKNQFQLLKTQRDNYSVVISTKESELTDRQNELKAILTIVDNYQLGNNNSPTMFFESMNHNGTPSTIDFTSLQTMYKYGVMVKVSNAQNVQVSLNGNLKTATSNKWTLLGKIKDLTTSSVLITGSGSSVIDIQLTAINDNEFDAPNNDDVIINRYSPSNKQMQIDSKKAEIGEQKSYLTTIMTQITQLQSLLSSGKNFTPDQLIELQSFVKEDTYSNDSCIDPKDLLTEGQKHFDEVKVPQLTMNIDIINFLSVIEEQSKWDKLVLGDYITVRYERMGVRVKAKIIEINYDFEGESISLTIANVRNDGSTVSKMNDYLKKNANYSTTIDANKKDWLKAVVDVSDMSLLFDQFWDKVTNQINMSINNTTTIDNRGITVVDPNDPLRFIRMTSGAIGLTKSGGQRWETALTADGIIAETLYGKIILSQRVIVGDAAGIWLMEGPRTTIKDRYGRIAMQLGLYEENPDKFGMIINRYNSNDINSTLINKVIADSDDGFKIQRYNGHSFVDVFNVDINGFLYSEDMTTKRLKILSDQNELLLDSYTKQMNIGKFTEIITDGKLTGIEKLQVLGERTRIISEYAKLFDQANIYKITSRDALIMIDIPPFTLAYNNLIAYLSPLLADNNMTTTSDIDRDEFILKFKVYYDQVVAIVQAINDSIKYSSLQLGSLYNNVLLDALDGITVTRSDEMYRTRLNATDGISIEKQVNGNWIKKFYINVEDSRLWVEELVAKKLTIVNDFNDVFLDIDSSYLNIGRFTNIITDNKLTSIEKLTLKQEWQTIQTEYVKLLQQANQYKTSQRDNYTKVLIDIPPFTTAFNNLVAYVIPLLADMSATTDIDRDVFANKFQAYYNQAQRIINEITDAVKWSSLQLGESYNKVVVDALNGITVTRSDNIVETVLNATDGISIKRNGEKVFYADTYGVLHAIDLVAKRLKITSDPFGGESEDALMIDASTKRLYLDRWDLVGASRIDAEMLAASIVSAEFGFISNLTAQRLSTMTRSAIGSWANFINIEGNSIQWITGIAAQGAHKTLSDGRPLYWVESSQTGRMTTDVTPWPVYEYTIDSANKKIKAEFAFDGTGDSANPFISMGIGDGATATSGRGKISKYNGGLKINYGNSNYGHDRSVDLRDDGVFVNSDGSKTQVTTKDFTVTSDNGTIKIGNTTGALFEIRPDNKMVFKGSEFLFENI
ncbi:phage tail spike protein [Paenibacillus donghaensis]|uniref:Uncharacterized protein n=1 Tax=Paenibacillus donghaensis TaxID=414771 RepID=A0A2Z2KB63_9BACL|nr:phage tail spike protein [Paenibacillus donghaensis]ASA22767.1 hypothetical protein B9T62_19360 [Paenibacillus donghaensis]